MGIQSTTVKMAIRERARLTFDYQGTKDDSPSRRTVLPYAFGRKASGKEFVLGFQVEGGSAAGIRLFDFSSMNNVSMASGTFDVPEDSVKADQWTELYESVK